MAQVEQHKKEFIKHKLEELRDYVQTQGVTPAQFGSMLVGYGAGLVAAHDGIPKAKACLVHAADAVDFFYGPKAAPN